MIKSTEHYLLQYLKYIFSQSATVVNPTPRGGGGGGVGGFTGLVMGQQQPKASDIRLGTR